ncbi:MAG: copper resistance D family protein [Actinomycetota bacterium]
MGIEEDLLQVSFTLVRFGAFVANSLIFGAVPLFLLVLRPGFKALGPESWRVGRLDLAARIEGLVRASLVASVVATVLALLLQTTLVATLAGGDLRLDSLEVVLDTSFGIWNVLRIPVLGALGVLLFNRLQVVSLSGIGEGEARPGPLWWALWGVLSLSLLATWSFSGHASVSSPVWLALINDVVHLGAGATWFAGIIVLAIALPDAWQGRTASERTRMLSEVVPRFSRMAVVAIAVIAATGTLNSFLNMETPRDLIDSGYGRVVLIKIGLFVGVVVLGAINHLHVRKRLAAASSNSAVSDPYRLFRRTIATELVLGLLLMGSTGLLVGLPRTRKTPPPQSVPAVTSVRQPGLPS